MPPKSRAQADGKMPRASAKGQAAKRGGSGGGGGDDFDGLLKQLQQQTKQSGEDRAKEVAKDEARKRAAAQRHAEIKKGAVRKGAHEIERALERQAQQRMLQQLLERMMAANRTFLKAPDTRFHTERAESAGFEVGVGAMQGWRAAMEDAHLVDVDYTGGGGRTGLFGVFDGHSGTGCSLLAKSLLPAACTRHLRPSAASAAAAAASSSSDGNGGGDGAAVDFAATFREIDVELRAQLRDGSGSTAVAVLVTPSHVACASVGDSRAVLCRAGGDVVALSDDHKPELPAERERIEAAGGRVEANRVNGQLAMSRALGDFEFKRQESRPADQQLVIAVPDIVSVARLPGDEFVVLACDGIFDVLSNEELVAFIREELAEPAEGDGAAAAAAAARPTLSEVAHSVCRRCLAPAAESGDQPAQAAGTDNMTLVIVRLK